MVRWQKECINKQQPWEGIHCAEDNTKMQQMRPGRKLCWHDNLHYRPSWTGTHIVPQQTSYIYCDLAHSQQPYLIAFGCTKSMTSTACPRLCDRYSLTPCRTLLIFVALLTLRVRTRSRGLLVSFNCWAFMAFQLAVSWYCPREIPGAPVYLHLVTAMARSLQAFDI